MFDLLTGARGKKQTKKELDAQYEIARNKQAIAWALKHRVEKCNLLDKFMTAQIPTAWLEIPRGDLASRPYYKEHARLVKEFIKVKGLLKIKIEVLVFRGELEAAGIDPDNMIFDITKPKPPGIHFYAIIGAHSTGAAGALHADRPKHADWLIVPCIMHCCEDTDENSELAVVYGGIDNMVADQGKKLDVWDVTVALHVHRCRVLSRPREKKAAKAMWAKAKADVMSRFSKLNSATMGSLEVVAGHMGETWDLIYVIMMGECPDINQKKIVKPTNLAWAKDMSNIPLLDLNRWLQRVVSGEYATKDFLNRCIQNLYKKQLRVQSDICEYVNTMRPDEEHKDFAAVGKKYKAFFRREVFDQMVNWCGAVAKEKLNVHVQDVCRDILDAHDRSIRNEEEVSFVLFYYVNRRYCKICMCVCVTGAE